jgi:CRISPR/Cas system endoribonuclease Cas6 (RAMP superfamily)
MVCRTTLIYSAENTEKILSDIGVKLHGALMNIIPKQLAACLHTTELQPFSLCCAKRNDLIVARINALETSALTLCEALGNCREITVYGMDEPLTLLSSEKSAVTDFDGIAADFFGKMPYKRTLRLDINSPAMIKSGGVPSCPPDIVKYFRSVLRKYNLFENKSVDFGEFETIFRQMLPEKYSLNGSSFNKSGSILPGLTGFTELPLPREQANAELIARMAKYAEYCGLGAKTAMGMGGCAASWVE